MSPKPKASSSLSLYQAEEDAALRIVIIHGGYEVRRSFNQLGIHTGDRVRIVRRAPFGGPVVLENQGTRLAVSKELAEQVGVEVLG